MSTRTITPTPKTYAQLRDAVFAVIVEGRAAIDRAWVDTCHETGRLINEHVLLFRDRAAYGAGIYEQLAADTRISVRTLRECAQFQRYFPIRRNCAELGWSQCRLLCQVTDEAQRMKLLQQAVKNRWRVPELETRVRAINAVALASDEATPTPPVEFLTPRCGTPGLHPIVDRGDGPEVDLGFRLYRELGPTARLTPQDIVRLTADGVRKVDRATTAQLFTYAATVRKVVDGDTLVIALAVAPGIKHELKLRLRGLDCPEISTAAGRAAKAFVDARLRAGDEIVVSTTKPDKYDRYLADVFVRAVGPRLEAERATPPGEGLAFLNNALLEAGHATRYDGGAKKE